MNSPLVGLEITPTQLRLVELRKKHPFSVKTSVRRELAEGQISPGFHSLNLASSDDDLGLSRLFEKAKIRTSSLCLTIPSVCGKIFFLTFDEISDSRDSMRQLIRWRIGKQLPQNGLETTISYLVTGQDPEGGYQVMAVVMDSRVVKEYVTLLRAAGKKIKRLELDFLAAYNFFEKQLSVETNYLFAYAGFNDVSLLFFQNGQPAFYHRLNLGLSDYIRSIARLKKKNIAQARQFLLEKNFFVDPKTKSPQDILENFSLIKEVNEELFKKIYDSCRYFLNLKQGRLTRIFLCGEGFSFHNIETFASNFLETDCERLICPVEAEQETDPDSLLPALGSIQGGANE